MTKTVREREPNSLPLHRFYALFRLRFIPERNKHHSTADFFNLKREPGDLAADTWKRITEIEKNCYIENKAAELLPSKFLSVYEKTTADNELKKKIKKERHVGRSDNRQNPRIQKPEKEKPNNFRKVDCIRCGAPNWNKQHDYSAKHKMPKLWKNRPLRKTVPNQIKIGPEDKTHLPGIRSNQRRGG